MSCLFDLNSNNLRSAYFSYIIGYLLLFSIEWIVLSFCESKDSLLLSLQTDTSSVLKEAMEYIGFLHKQVKVWPFLLHYAEIITVNFLLIWFHMPWAPVLGPKLCMISGPDVNFVITYLNNILFLSRHEIRHFIFIKFVSVFWFLLFSLVIPAQLKNLTW